MADSAAPGAVLGVSVAGRHRFHGTGRLGVDDATKPDSATVYDLASLTKAVGLTTAVMPGTGEGLLALDSSIARHIPEFAPAYPSAGLPDRLSVTIRHLLTHSSGLPAWRALHQLAPTRATALALVDSTPLDAAPGVRSRYSDLGAILLTQTVERAFGQRLDSLIARRVFLPLAMADTRFLPPDGWRSRIAPTEDDPWRGRVLRGEVHDENAARLDGVSGHAGLFSSARDLLRFGDWLLAKLDCTAEGTGCPRAFSGCAPHGIPAPRGAQRRDEDSDPPIAPATVEEFVARQNLPPGSSRALGWDTPSPGSSAGTRLSPGSFGHTGFTGASLWIDPGRCLAIVLLSNRVHPTRQNDRWGPVRGRVADAAVGALPQPSASSLPARDLGGRDALPGH